GQGPDAVAAVAFKSGSRDLDAGERHVAALWAKVNAQIPDARQWFTCGRPVRARSTGRDTPGRSTGAHRRASAALPPRRWRPARQARSPRARSRLLARLQTKASLRKPVRRTQPSRAPTTVQTA